MAFSPKSQATFSLPKKFQLRMVEKAKNSRQRATKARPTPVPNTEEKASWAMLVLSMP